MRPQVKSDFVIGKTRLFFPNDLIQLASNYWIISEHAFVQQHNILFRERSHSEFPMKRVADFSYDQNVKWCVKNVGDLGGYHNPSSRQTQNQIGFQALVP